MASEPSAAQKRMLAKMGLSMPDGSYYIRNGSVGAEDLANAIKAVGRGGADHDDIRKFIMKRAAALKLSKEIPDTWNPDGSLKQPAVAAQSANEIGEKFISHFGRKGMKWGAHVFTSGGGSAGGVDRHTSADAARAAHTAHMIKTHGVHSVPSADLQHLVSRLNLETQHEKLTSANPGGKKVATDIVKNVAKQQAQQLASQYAQKGVEHIAKHVAAKIAGG